MSRNFADGPVRTQKSAGWMPALVIQLYFQTIRSEGVNPPFFKLYIRLAMKRLKKIEGKKGLDNIFPKLGNGGGRSSCGDGPGRGLARRTLTRHRMPHPWQFHGWAAAKSPWHVHWSQLNRRVPVISFPCRPTCTGTTALDTPTLLRQAVISAALFSAHHALAISF